MNDDSSSIKQAEATKPIRTLWDMNKSAVYRVFYLGFGITLINFISSEMEKADSQGQVMAWRIIWGIASLILGISSYYSLERIKKCLSGFK